MKNTSKRFLLSLVIIVCSSCFVQASRYLQIGFVNDEVVPTATASGDLLTLEFHDASLTDLFKNYSVTEFVQEYPAASVFATSILKRVYRIRIADGLDDLYNSIIELNSGDVDNVFKVNDPVPLYDPNDYCDVSPDICSKIVLDLINAKGAWDLTRGLPCIKIGITDIGFFYHNDIDSNVFNINSLPSGVSVATNPSFRHGTEVAGVAAAITNNGTGLASLGYNVKVGYYPISIDGVLQAANDGCKVINCSWYSATSPTPTTPSSYDLQVIDSVHKLGSTIVAAAGNGIYNCSSETWDDTSYYYPASYRHVISVTSVSSNYEVGTYLTDSSFPNCNYQIAANWKDSHRREIDTCRKKNMDCGGVFKPFPLFNMQHNHNDSVDICAPGYWVPILSAYNGTGADAGTSLAAPFVSAAAALVYSLNPNFTPDQVEYYLKQGAYDISGVWDNYLWNGKLGAGRLDAGASLELAKDSACLPAFTGFSYGVPFGATSLNLSFSLTTTALSDVEWEFISGTDIVTKTGSTVPLALGDFPEISGERRCLPLTVYVRQGSGCCYSAYYKQTIAWPDVVCDDGGGGLGRFANNLNKTTNPNGLKAYPSPAKDYLTVSLDMSKQKSPSLDYQVFGIEGKAVKQGKLIGNSTTLNISTLAKGVYFIKTNLGTAKFIKE